MQFKKCEPNPLIKIIFLIKDQMKQQKMKFY